MFDTLTRLGASGVTSSYEIGKSLRFDGTGAYLTKTPTAGDRDVWTFSCWYKPAGGPATSTDAFVLFQADTGTVDTYQFSDSKLNMTIQSGSDTGTTTTGVFRDPSSWYHICSSYDGSNLKLYINGVLDKTTSHSGDAKINSNVAHYIGQNGSSARYLPGYLAEFHFVDGTAKQASDFGETDATTGQWIPIKYSGSHGSQGYYLKFDDTSNFGLDSSGNGNNWTASGFSGSAGVGNDSVTDTPTNNYPILNPLDGYSTMQYDPINGCLDFSIGDPSAIGLSTISIPTSGKWYAECTPNALESVCFGIRETQFVSYSNSFETGILYLYTGHTWKNNSNIESVTAPSSGNIMGCAVDRDSNTVQFSLNGTNVGSTIAMTAADEYQWWVARGASSGSNPTGSVNFGQRAFSHQPSGFVGLCTSELPEPTILKGSDHFNTVLYTGNDAASHAITGVGFQPDLVWIKARSAAYDHRVYDDIRGVNAAFLANTTAAEDQYAGYGQFKSFDSDGFTVGNGTTAGHGTNTNSVTHAAFNWKESATAGFDIVSYTGNGSARTISHSLGVAPEMMIVKRRDGADNWMVYHKDNGNTHYLELNSTGGKIDNTIWNDTTPTSSVFSLGTDGSVNASSATYIAYLWASVKGYSKVNSFLGNGNANGPFVYTGFRPAWVLVRGGGHNLIWHNEVEGYNPTKKAFLANANNAEEALDGWSLDFYSNGFKMRGTDASANESGTTFVYLAMAESPFKYSNAR